MSSSNSNKNVHSAKGEAAKDLKSASSISHPTSSKLGTKRSQEARPTTAPVKELCQIFETDHQNNNNRDRSSDMRSITETCELASKFREAQKQLNNRPKTAPVNEMLEENIPGSDK